MRAHHIVFAALPLLLAARLGAQAGEPVAPQFRVNFAVPDAPAFEILGVEPSDLLRPASVRELTAAVSNFGSLQNGISLPRSFTTEFSPAMLIRGAHLSIREYQHDPALYRLRVSAATNRASDSARIQVGLGARISLIDAADPRTDADYVSAVTNVLTQINRIYAAQLTEPPLPPDVKSGVVDPSILTPARRQQVEQLQGQITQLKKDREQRFWNARILDIAYAVRASAADSIGNGARVDAHSLWATFGTGFGQWGQLLIGVRGAMERDTSDTSEFSSSGSVAARFYAGSNDYKFFLESQLASGGPADDRVLFHGGAEVALPYSFWANASVGLEQPTGGGRARLVTRFALKSGLPVTR
jgi:hypothetical protein